MKTKMKFKRVLAGLVCASALALSANAQAFDIDAGVFATGAGDAANPFIFNVNPTNPPPTFTDTINFDMGLFTHFNMTSTATDILGFGATIFQNVTDGQVPGTIGSATHLNVPLPNLGLTGPDYHLHPAGFLPGASGSYQITMWGSTPAAVPVPAAIYLFGSGLIGLVGLARRKMKAMA